MFGIDMRWLVGQMVGRQLGLGMLFCSVATYLCVTFGVLLNHMTQCNAFSSQLTRVHIPPLRIILWREPFCALPPHPVFSISRRRYLSQALYLAGIISRKRHLTQTLSLAGIISRRRYLSQTLSLAGVISRRHYLSQASSLAVAVVNHLLVDWCYLVPATTTNERFAGQVPTFQIRGCLARITLASHPTYRRVIFPIYSAVWQVYQYILFMTNFFLTENVLKTLNNQLA